MAAVVINSWAVATVILLKIMATLVGVFLVYLIFFLGTAVRNNIKSLILLARPINGTYVTVNGYGKVNGNNDIAMTTIGYSNTDKDVGQSAGGQ